MDVTSQAKEGPSIGAKGKSSTLLMVHEKTSMIPDKPPFD